MTSEDGPMCHCQLDEAVDLLTVLEAATIEHLDVDEDRAVVIYQSSILMVIAIDGQITSARAFDIELWEESPHDSNLDPDDLLSAFIDELLATSELSSPSLDSSC